MLERAHSLEFPSQEAIAAFKAFPRDQRSKVRGALNACLEENVCNKCGACCDFLEVKGVPDPARPDNRLAVLDTPIGSGCPNLIVDKNSHEKKCGVQCLKYDEEDQSSDPRLEGCINWDGSSMDQVWMGIAGIFCGPAHAKQLDLLRQYLHSGAFDDVLEGIIQHVGQYMAVGALGNQRIEWSPRSFVETYLNLLSLTELPKDLFDIFDVKRIFEIMISDDASTKLAFDCDNLGLTYDLDSICKDLEHVINISNPLHLEFLNDYAPKEIRDYFLNPDQESIQT